MDLRQIREGLFVGKFHSDLNRGVVIEDFFFTKKGRYKSEQLILKKMAEKMFYKNTTIDVQKLLKIVSEVKEKSCKKSVALLETQISHLQTSLQTSKELNRTQRELIQIQRKLIQEQRNKILGS